MICLWQKKNDSCSISAGATDKAPVFQDNLMGVYALHLLQVAWVEKFLVEDSPKHWIHNMFFNSDSLHAGSSMFSNVMQHSAFQLRCPDTLLFAFLILLPHTQCPSFPKVLTNATERFSVWNSLTRMRVLIQILCSNFMRHAQPNMMCVSAISTTKSHTMTALAKQRSHTTLHTEQLMFKSNRGGSYGGAMARQIWPSHPHSTSLFTGSQFNFELSKDPH
jgi:hypothetical protein